MRNLVLSIAASAALLTAAPLASAQAPSDGRLIYGTDAVGIPPTWRDVQFLFGGRNYCWYPDGWHGAGYYWCGYAYRRGLGWGGPVGWHGWRGGGHGGGDHGGFGDHGGADRHDAIAHGGPGGGHGGPPGGDHGGGGHAEGGHGGGGHAEGGHGGGGHGDGGHH